MNEASAPTGTAEALRYVFDYMESGALKHLYTITVNNPIHPNTRVSFLTERGKVRRGKVIDYVLTSVGDHQPHALIQFKRWKIWVPYNRIFQGDAVKVASKHLGEWRQEAL